MFQSYHILPELSILENVMLPGLLDGKSSSFCRKRAEALLPEEFLDVIREFEKAVKENKSIFGKLTLDDRAVRYLPIIEIVE